MASPVSSTSARASHPVRRIARSFGFATRGLGTVVRTQPNFWVHLSAAALAIAAGIVLRISPTEWAIVILTIGLVLVVEAVNTALEAVCDLVSTDYHPLIAQAKDVSAAAVLIAAAAAVLIGLCLFGPRLASLAR